MLKIIRREGYQGSDEAQAEETAEGVIDSRPLKSCSNIPYWRYEVKSKEVEGSSISAVCGL